MSKVFLYEINLKTGSTIFTNEKSFKKIISNKNEKFVEIEQWVQQNNIDPNKHMFCFENQKSYEETIYEKIKFFVNVDDISNIRILDRTLDKK